MMRRDYDFGFIVQSPYNVVESYHPHIKQNSIYDNSKKLYQINLDLLEHTVNIICPNLTVISLSARLWIQNGPCSIFSNKSCELQKLQTNASQWSTKEIRDHFFPKFA